MARPHYGENLLVGDIAALIEQFGAWAFVAIIAGFLLKYVILDLRKDNERNYGLCVKLHNRMDDLSDELKEMSSELIYLQGKMNGKK
jgi:hypothetical protein